MWPVARREAVLARTGLRLRGQATDSIGMRIGKCNIWLVLAAALLAPHAVAFPAEDDQSPGTMAIHFNKQTNVWSRLDFGVLDGKVTTSPPDTTKYDRRAESLGILGAETLVGQRFGVRFNVKGEISKRRQQEASGPTATVDSTVKTFKPSVDLTFITDKGLELFGGVESQIVPGYTESVNSTSGESTTKFASSTVASKRFGVVRRTSAWAGGFYYQMGAEETRTVTQTAFDGSGAEVDDVVFIPSKIGVMGNFQALSALWDFEFDFIQARGKGPKDDQGNTTYTDYFEAHFGSLFFFGSGIGMNTSVFHKTLSYANNAFVTIETIPVTSVKLLGVLGDAQNNAFLGIIGAYGKDGQSLPEFNATYQVQAYALTFGSSFSL